MSANFWESHCAKQLVSKQRLEEAHMEDKLRGLTEDHIRQINVHFVHSLFELAKLCKLRQRVASTAAMYFRKFYLANSFCRKDPRLVFAGCLYLATKAEESLLAAKHLVTYVRKQRAGWNYDVKHLLDVEMVILEDMDFNLIVFNPYRALETLVKDLGIPELAQPAWAVLNDSYRTDVSLMFAPHVVALGCMQLAAATLERDIAPWLQTLNVDAKEVFSVSLELASMYEHSRNAISVEECNRLLDFVAVRR